MVSTRFPRELRLDLERPAKEHDRSLSAELRRAAGLYVRVADKRKAR